MKLDKGAVSRTEQVKKDFDLQYGKDFYEKNKDYLKLIDEESKRDNLTWFKDYYHSVLNHSLPGDKILECGCGTGITTSFIHEHRKSIIGTDFSSRFIKIAKERNGNYFKAMNSTKLEFEDSSFDLVCSADMIEHVPEVNKALSEMNRVLGDNGFLVIQAPNLFCNLFSFNYKKTLKNISRKVMHLFSDLLRTELRTIEKYELDVYEADRDAYNLVSPIWLKKELKKKGYKIKEFTSYSYPFKTGKLLNIVLRIFSKMPIVKYLGGRIVIVAQKQNGK
jgi:ubiquinone/menaquinone biosynthesis C-methylase UbiE